MKDVLDEKSKAKDQEILELKKRIEELQKHQNQHEFQLKDQMKQKDQMIQSLQDQNKLLRELRTENIQQITKIRQKLQDLQVKGKNSNEKENIPIIPFI